MEITRDPDVLRGYAAPVAAIGNFDGVHAGHQAILRTAINEARAVQGSAFALTFDPMPPKVLAPERAPKLILTPEDKVELLRGTGLDAVLVLEFTLPLSRLTPREFAREYLVKRIGVRAVVVGHSVSFGYRREGNAQVMAELGRELGFNTRIVGPVTVEGIEASSTKIRELIAEGDLITAAKLLGRSHFLRGPVVHGRERGRTIGFPTANIQSRTELLPPDGVYATRIVLPDGSAHGSITNIGIRPTFAEPERTIEAHIFNFGQDIYDQDVKLELIERIRPEKKFESGAALAAQIASDVTRAKSIVGAA
ncbi:MAG TPA: bifunctional riboflavin kinase/FAD synthetase [Candidatus Binataceae bacterium]|nr:bifunctional riboflavin kinase/FAD synthetase [Candidatus Binataceae bacterium]